MKQKFLYLMFLVFMVPLAAVAQYWESGTVKTNTFFNYTSGGNTYAKTEVSYLINSEQDGKMEFYTNPLGDVRITGISLYAVEGEDLLFVANGAQTLIVEDVAAGLYEVKFFGQPTDHAGQGGTFQAGYVLTPADYVNDPEPNNTWERAYEIQSGNEQHGHLGYKRAGNRDVEDWFKIVVPDEGTVTLSLHASTRLHISWLSLYVPNADSTDVQQRNSKWMDNGEKDTTLVFTSPDCKPGIYYIRLQRNSSYGSYKMGYTFTPSSYKAEPADNETWDKALDMALDTPTEGRLGYNYYQNADRYDWYKIVVPEEGKLTFVLKAEPTLRISWLSMHTPNAEGTDVKERNSRWMDNGGKDTTLVYEVPDVAIGTYYVLLQRNSGYGGYRLTPYFTSHADEADPEPNDTWAEALPLKSGPAVTGQLGYNYNNNTDIQDWYRIEVPKEGAVVVSIKTESTLRMSWASLNVPNADSTDVVQRNSMWIDAAGKDTTLVFNSPDCKPGTYYLLMQRNSGYGTYTLQYIHNPNAHENDPEPNDKWTAATLIESGTTQQGCLGYNYYQNPDRYDWFKIDLKDEGSVSLALTAETTLRMSWIALYVPNAEGSDVTQRNSKWIDNGGKDTTLVFTVPDCKPGIYYALLERNSGYGGYDLDYTFTPNVHNQDNPDNDTWDKATAIESGTTQQGRLGYNYYNNTDRYDWFKINVTDEGSVSLALTAETTLRMSWIALYVPNAEGSDVTQRNSKWIDNGGKDTTLVFTVPDCKPGIYYALLERNSGYGGYKLNYTFTPNVHNQDYADNDTWDKATVIESGTTQQGRLGYNYYQNADRYDWYKIEVPYVGNVALSIHSETTLHLSWLGLYIPKEDGSDVSDRSSTWVDNGGKDTTLVLNANGMGAGTYYVRLVRNSGYGGYTLKYEYERNPYDRDNLQNDDFAHRYTLTEGQTVSTTLGYSYRKQNNEDWYDLGLLHGRQIDVTVAPDTTHTLVIGVPALYIYKGDNEDGSPILQKVAESRIERSQGTISYIDRNTEDSHYVFRVPNYNSSSYGGYTILFGSEKQEGNIDLATNVTVMTGGRNTVRKGVPCENPITITNTSNQKTSKFMVSVTTTDNIDIIGFRIPTSRGTQYVPLDSVTVLDGNTCQHTVLFYVPCLNPWESYTFTMVSEGKGDIAYSRAQQEQAAGTNKIIVNSDTYAVVNILGNVAGADKHVFVDDFIVQRIGDVYGLTGEQRLKLSWLLGQLETKKQQTGEAVFSVRQLLQSASDLCGIELLDATCPLLTIIRQYVLNWIYQEDTLDDGIIDIIDGKAAITDVVASWDPNEMVGPQGVGNEHYIGDVQTVNYRILFENKAEAGDAAYRVRISDELDENVFDVSTVRFGGTSHDGVGYNWVMTREGNKLSWDIQGIELPPNVNAPEGEGYVTFSVDLKPGLKDGTELKNKATIIFDKNFPIETNEFVNTLDLTAPVTTMAEAQYVPEAGAMRVTFSAADAASGVQSYLLFVSEDGGDYAYCGQSTTPVMDYAVDSANGRTYSFFVLATDNVGNTERTQPQSVEGKATGINSVVRNDNAVLRIYTVDGRYVGSDVNSLPKGVYVIGGKKYIK